MFKRIPRKLTNRMTASCRSITNITTTIPLRFQQYNGAAVEQISKNRTIASSSKSDNASPQPAVNTSGTTTTYINSIGAGFQYAGSCKNPQFIVGPENGFLPIQDPLIKLPDEFSALESLLQRMPLKMTNGKPGLLWEGQFGDAVLKELPLYDVDKIEDGALFTALFRDYTFAASAYLLEPCDLLYRKTKKYGLGRQVLPKQLAVPLHKIAEKIDAKPFMEYAQSYALYNYKKKDPLKGLDYNNLALIREFSGYPSEHGFILVHVAMVAHSGKLVNGTLGALEACAKRNRPAFDNSMSTVINAMKNINQVMETMWGRSLPEDYNSFRTFIMGTKNQPMFPHGVLYEGLDEQPRFYRGESGANDSIIPTMDNLLELTSNMPSNPLTSILKDFRSYRPKHHNQWLQYVEQTASQLSVRSFAQANPQSTILYLLALDQVREFRQRHWNFTKQYILKHTTHPVATGGSPIVTWLPNQLTVVLNAMLSCKINNTQDLDPFEKQLHEETMERVYSQKRVLERDVAKLSQVMGHRAVEAAAIN